MRAGGYTLQPTALVDESWLKLQGPPGFKSRAHILGIAARAMRHLLDDWRKARAWLLRELG